MRDEASKRKSASGAASFVLRFDNHKSSVSSSKNTATPTAATAAARTNEATTDEAAEEEPRVTIVDMRSVVNNNKTDNGSSNNSTLVTTRADVYRSEQPLPSTSSGIRHSYHNGQVRSQQQQEQHQGRSPENVMTTTTDPSITLQDEQRQTGKITPSSPRSNNSTTESSKSMGGGSGSGGGSDSSPRDSASTKSEELEVPVTKSTLPMPQSAITRVPTAGDHVDSAAKLKNNVNGGGADDPSVEKLHAAGEHNGLGAAAGGGEDEEERVDLNDIPFIVNCLYVTQQCCECSIM